jgi:hypothetical protein
MKDIAFYPQHAERSEALNDIQSWRVKCNPATDDAWPTRAIYGVYYANQPLMDAYVDRNDPLPDQQTMIDMVALALQGGGT